MSRPLLFLLCLLWLSCCCAVLLGQAKPLDRVRTQIQTQQDHPSTPAVLVGLTKGKNRIITSRVAPDGPLVTITTPSELEQTVSQNRNQTEKTVEYYDRDMEDMEEEEDGEVGIVYDASILPSAGSVTESEELRASIGVIDDGSAKLTLEGSISAPQDAPDTLEGSITASSLDAPITLEGSVVASSLAQLEGFIRAGEEARATLEGSIIASSEDLPITLEGSIMAPEDLPVQLEGSISAPEDVDVPMLLEGSIMAAHDAPPETLEASITAPQDKPLPLEGSITVAMMEQDTAASQPEQLTAAIGNVGTMEAESQAEPLTAAIGNVAGMQEVTPVDPRIEPVEMNASITNAEAEELSGSISNSEPDQHEPFMAASVETVNVPAVASTTSPVPTVTPATAPIATQPAMIALE